MGGYCDASCPLQETGSGSGETGSGSGASCITNDGPAAGSACAFPFNYMGVLHFGCTQIDEDFAHVPGVGAWGYCDATCPVQETPATTTAAPATCQCGVKGGSANGRIVGGQETEVHEYPWQVGLVSRNGRSPWCGGTLISSTHVLTG